MIASETRIIPLPPMPTQKARAAMAMVSMPKTAWYWLDDLVSRNYPGGYRALVRDFTEAASCPESLATALRHRAEAHAHEKMAALYNLSNDNQRAPNIQNIILNAALPDMPDLSSRMPVVYQLFRFLAHPTYLTTVWERRNYHLRDLTD